MKNPKHLPKLILCAGFLSLASVQGQEPQMAMVPLRPAELLKFLPAAPSGWRMTVSTGEDIPNAWPRSKATREFVLEAAGAGGEAAVAVTKVQVTLIDTGGYPDSLQRFAPPQPGEEKPQEERITIASMPAFRRAMPGEKERVDVLALNRFLMIATVQAMPAPNAARAPLPKPEKPEEWIEKFNIEALRDASKKIERMDVSKDHSMVVEKIDEINPKLSSKSTWSFSVEEQIQGRK